MKYLKKITSGMLAAALLFSLPSPAAAESGQKSDVPVYLNDLQGSVINVKKGLSGGYYVMATENCSEVQSLESVGVYLYKYDDALANMEAQYSVTDGITSLGDFTASTGKTYPLFLDSAGQVYAADDRFNGAIAQGSDGSIYIAYKSVDVRNTVSLSAICLNKDVFPDCTCSVCDVMNEGALGHCVRLKEATGESEEDEYESADDCPVCSAWHDAYRSVDSEDKVVRLVVEKLSPSLEPLAKYSAAYNIGKASQYSVMTPSAVTIGKDGSVYVSGRTDKDFLKELSPEKSFSDYKYNMTPENSGTASEQARGFIMRLSSDLSEVRACTYLGGMFICNQYVGGASFVSSMAVSESGDIYAGGGEYSGMIQTGSEAFQKEHCEQNAMQRTQDAFIAQLDPVTLKVKNATYYGGSSSDFISKIILKDGCVYAAGMSMSPDLKMSSGAYQNRISSGGATYYYDGFVLRLSESLSNDEQFASTYIGSNQRDEVYDFDISSDGKIAVTGYTYGQSTYPVTDGSSAGTYYVSVLNSDLSRIITSSMLKQGTGRVIMFVPDNFVITAGETIEQGKWTTCIDKMSASLAHADVTGVYRLEKPASLEPVYLGSGQKLNIIVAFDSPVLVVGSPELKLNMTDSEGKNVYAVYREPTAVEKENMLYSAGNRTKYILFSCDINDGYSTGSEILNCIGSEALEVPDGSGIFPLAGSDGNINLEVPMNSLGLSQSKVYINTKQAAAASVKADVESGIYGAGAVIPVTVDFGVKCLTAEYTDKHEIYINMNNGGRAYFDSIDEKTGCAVFKYTVSQSDSSVEKLCYKGNIILNGGSSLKDEYGTNVNTVLPEADSKAPMGKEIAIDVLAASVVSVTADKTDTACKKGDIVKIIVTFDKPVTSSGEARLALNVLNGSYVTAPAVKNSKTLEFTYMVDSENTASGQYLDYISATSLSMAEGAVIRTNGGSIASLSLPAPGTEKSLASSHITVDTKAPAVQRVNRNSTASGNYKLSKFYRAGEKLLLEAQMSENVYVKENADIYVELETGIKGEPLKLKYEGYGSNTRSIVFSYTIAEGDTLKNATLKNTTGKWEICAEEGDITDAAGNSAELSLPLPNSADNAWSGIYFDTDLPEWSDGKLTTASLYKNDLISSELAWSEAFDVTSGLNASGFYSVYRDGILIGTTNARVYTDYDIKKGKIYHYEVRANDKADNQSISLETYFTYIDLGNGSYTVEPEENDIFVPVEGSPANMMNAVADADKSDLKLNIKSLGKRASGEQDTENEKVTVMWVMFDGNKMKSYGSQEINVPYSDAPSASAGVSVSLALESVKKGDSISIFVIKEPLKAVKGAAVNILNKIIN